MELDFFFYAVAVPVVLYAGIDKSGFGSATSVAATAFLVLILEPAQAVAIMLPLLVVMDFTALRPNWRKWDPPTTKVMLTGTTLGAFLGAGVFFLVTPDVLRLLIGVIALAFVAIQAARRSGLMPDRGEMREALGYVFATGAGVTSFVAHSGGPVASIYLLSKRLDKTAYQATTIVTFWINNLIKVVLYLWLGLLSRETVLPTLTLMPVAILGTFLGVRLNRRLPEKIYFAVIYLFLTITGTKLIYDALT